MNTRIWIGAAVLVGGLLVAGGTSESAIRRSRTVAPMPPVPQLAMTREGIPDANADGRSDVDNILGCIAYLTQQGVVYDDQDGGGHIPTRRADGRFHMCCVDLVTVCYRNAGYEFGGANDSFTRVGSSYYRQTAHLRQRVMSDPRFRYFPGPNTNPLVTAWRPAQPFRVGDIVFQTYEDTHENHVGIVTSVDTRNGLPSTVTQISSYTPTGGIHRSTWREFNWLRCRTLVGWARPTAWDATPQGATERALTGHPPVGTDANPTWMPSASSPMGALGLAGLGDARLQAALDKVRASRNGVYAPPTPQPVVVEALMLGPRNRHAMHFFRD